MQVSQVTREYWYLQFPVGSLMSFREKTLILSSDRQYLSFNPLTVHNFSFPMKKAKFDISGSVFCSEHKSFLSPNLVFSDRSINNNNNDLHGMCMELVRRLAKECIQAGFKGKSEGSSKSHR